MAVAVTSSSVLVPKRPPKRLWPGKWSMVGRKLEVVVRVCASFWKRVSVGVAVVVVRRSRRRRRGGSGW